MTARPRLGFIGLGLMGTAMSLRLLEKGYALNVWNLEPERVAAVVQAGAIAMESPAAVTRASDIVLMCVLHTQAVEQCVFGPNGIATAADASKLLIDHSTIDPARSRALAARLRQETRMGWIDAPVSGGPVAARQGTLTVMATMGDESMWAFRMPVTRFVAPGPSVDIATAARPVNRPWTSAMNAAPCSWRVVMWRTVGWSASASRMSIVSSPGTEKTYSQRSASRHATSRSAAVRGLGVATTAARPAP